MFCKTNWSAPLDAMWINAGSMKCQRTAEIYLLLKSSDRTAFDFQHMLAPQGLQAPSGLVVSGTESYYDNSDRHYTRSGFADDLNGAPAKPTLVLRKWCNLLPSMEFRLFVRDGKLGKLLCTVFTISCACVWVCRCVYRDSNLLYLRPFSFSIPRAFHSWYQSEGRYNFLRVSGGREEPKKRHCPC